MIDVELVIPDGWVQLPTSQGSERVRKRAIAAVIGHHVPDSLPRDKAGPWRRELTKRLEEATGEAARKGARSILMPLAPLHGMPLPGSMLLTVLEDDPAADPEELLGSILAEAGPDGAYLEIGGAPSVRVETVIGSGRIGRDAPSRKVSYYISHPDAPGYWALVTFAVLSDGDIDAEPVRAVVMLFDAVVCSMRWHEREAV